MTPKDILKKYWGYADFRLKQEEIINQVMNGKDTLALLPTGGGKSICYQIPSLMKEGVCLVISPLIALMNDQVRYLSSKGIKSIAITSNMTYSKIDIALNNCMYGNFKFLYLSPEKLQNEIIRKRISMMNINLITVDEAHCISEWGHNFRPSYRHISKIRSLLPEVPILALTATATNNVTYDIQDNLKFKKTNIIRSSFYRDNISYVVNNVIDKKIILIKLVQKIKSSVIVYVSSRKECKEISDFLNFNKFPSSYYHAGLTYSTRKERQKKWTENETRIMVATSAFGMGINKEDVRLVVHMYLPSTIEAYFQEAGRAGRNGKQSYSYLLANKNDIDKQKRLLEIKNPSLEEIKSFYQKICNFLQIAENIIPEDDIPFNIIEFSKRYNISNLKSYLLIKYLEKEELIKFIESSNMSSKILFKINNNEIYKFQVANKYYDPFIKVILRMYSGIFNSLTPIKEEEISKKLNTTVNNVERILNRLVELNIIKYITSKNNATQIRFINKRVDSSNLPINEKELVERKEQDKNKLNKIIEFILSKNECRSILLLKYFGEEKEKKCEKCDYCINQKNN